MHKLLIQAQYFAKLAQIENGPDTEREPKVIDQKFRAYEFVGLLNILANLKNQLAKIKDKYPIFGLVFGELIRLRPGVIKNAIRDMVANDRFDMETYLDLEAATLKSIADANLVSRLEELSQLVEVELLSDEALTDATNGQIIESIKTLTDKAVRMLSAGLQYQ